MEEINIKDFLNTFPKDEPIYYIPNPGNGGDMLIACATLQVFNDLKIRCRIVNGETFEPKGKVVFYGGGGNLVPLYDYARKVIGRIHQCAKKIVILPHTISGNEDLLGSLGSNADVICRERISFAHVKKFAPRAQVMLSDDMGFHLKTERVLSSDGDSLAKAFFFELGFILKNNCGHIPWPKQLNRFLRAETRIFRLLQENKDGVLHCFRTDPKIAGRDLRADNIDISRVLSYGKVKETLTESVTLGVSNQMLRFINRYAKIETDRLHVAIGAAVLGKDVDLYRNSNYKNEAVYNYSLKDKFPNVRWIG
jgi:exopolysaccharide biosynthesis predicted pyruvyltransferase EpsI